MKNEPATAHGYDLRPDAPVGPPDAIRGFDAVLAWLEEDPLALALRSFTTNADVRLAIAAYPYLRARLRRRGDPYENVVGQYEADQARAAMDQIAP